MHLCGVHGRPCQAGVSGFFSLFANSKALTVITCVCYYRGEVEFVSFEAGKMEYKQKDTKENKTHTVKLYKDDSVKVVYKDDEDDSFMPFDHMPLRVSAFVYMTKDGTGAVAWKHLSVMALLSIVMKFAAAAE